MAVTIGGGDKGRAIKKEITFFPTAIKLERGGG